MEQYTQPSKNFKVKSAIKEEQNQGQLAAQILYLSDRVNHQDRKIRDLEQQLETLTQYVNRIVRR